MLIFFPKRIVQSRFVKLEILPDETDREGFWIVKDILHESSDEYTNCKVVVYSACHVSHMILPGASEVFPKYFLSSRLPSEPEYCSLSPESTRFGIQVFRD